jgi:hypothetical protein
MNHFTFDEELAADGGKNKDIFAYEIGGNCKKSFNDFRQDTDADRETENFTSSIDIDHSRYN